MQVAPLKADDERPKRLADIQFSPSTKEMLSEMTSAAHGDRAAVDELTKLFLRNRRLGFYAFGVFFCVRYFNYWSHCSHCAVYEGN